jgi:hypothetical protein
MSNGFAGLRKSFTGKDEEGNLKQRLNKAADASELGAPTHPDHNNLTG